MGIFGHSGVFFLFFCVCVGFSALGFKALGFRALGFRALGFRV